VLYFTVGPINAFISLLLVAIMYVILFTLGADIIFRFKIRDLPSLILLGSIYGLIIEGIFSDLIFREGIGPVILGLSFSNIAFTALSWHPVIDFCLGFILFSKFLKGEAFLDDKKIPIKEIIIIILFSLFWFSWSYSGVIIKNFPQGLPMIIQIFVLLFPIIIIGLLIDNAVNLKDYTPKRILNKYGYIISMGYIGFYSVLRIIALPNKFLFLSLLSIMLFYIFLFYVHLKYGRKESDISIIEESFPVRGNFNRVKWFLVFLIIIATYIIFKISADILHLAFIYYSFTIVIFITSMIFVVIFPIYVILNIIIKKIKD